MEELLTLSYNFREPIGVIVDPVNPKPINGIVDDLDEQGVTIAGERYPYRDIVGVQ